MGKNQKYKKSHKESFGQKFVNLILTIVVACAISSQVCTAANNNLRFAQISDAHFSTFESNTSYKLLEKSADFLDDAIFQLNTSGPYSFVIFTGDLVNKPKVSELNKFIQHAKKLNYPWYAINGNHDIAIDGELTKDVFKKTLSDCNKNMHFENIYYAFSPKKGFRVICMDSIIDTRLTSNGEYSEKEMSWLKKELDSHPKDVIIICTHVPIKEPYSSPNHRLNNQYEVRALLKQYSNPIIVLQGHYHATKAEQDNNLLYVSCPSLVTYPNSFRVINIKSNKEKVLVDIFLKETNLKELQNRAKLRTFGDSMLYGEENDRNTTFEIRRNKE